MPKLAANYLTVNPDGSVSAAFSGGLDLLTVPTGNPFVSTKSIRWHNQPNGALIAEIAAEAGTNDGFLDLNAYPVTPTGQGTATLRAITPDHLADSYLQVSSGTSGGNNSAIAAQVRGAPGGGGVRTILNSLGQSSFLQLAGVSANIIGMGGVTVSIGAGSVESNAVNLPIPAGGTTPMGCIATCNTYAGTGRVVGVQAFVTAGRFQIGFELNTAFGVVTNLDFSYLQWWT